MQLAASGSRCLRRKEVLAGIIEGFAAFSAAITYLVPLYLPKLVREGGYTIFQGMENLSKLTQQSLRKTRRAHVFTAARLMLL